MTKAVIRNPIIYHTGPMTIVAYTESEMTYYCTVDNIGKLIKYAGPAGTFENGAYYKVIADPVVPEEPDGALCNVTIADLQGGENAGIVIFDSPLGLEVGKSYTMRGQYGESPTPFETTATAVDGESVMGSDFAGQGIKIIMFASITVTTNHGDTNIQIFAFDGAHHASNGGITADSTKSEIWVQTGASLEQASYVNNFTAELIEA